MPARAWDVEHHRYYYPLPTIHDMPWYAVSAIDDALSTSKQFLFPFNRWRWIKLAVITLFVGGGTGGFGFPSFSFDVSLPSDTPTSPPVDAPSTETLVTVLAVLGVLVVGFVLLYGVVSAVMEFVFLDALRTQEIHLRRFFRRRLGKGIRLFGFQLGVTLLFVLPLLVAVVVGVWFGLETGSLGMFAGLLFVLIPVFILAAILGSLLLGFTTGFVAPVMLLEDRGVIAGWRRFWPTLRAEWKQYGVYVIVHWLLGIGVGILGLLVTGLAFVGALLMFGLVTGLVILVFGGIDPVLSSGVGLGVLGVLALVFGGVMIAVGLAIQIPIVTYFRYYALLVLGDTNPTFDLIPDLRATVRRRSKSSQTGEDMVE